MTSTEIREYINQQLFRPEEGMIRTPEGGIAYMLAEIALQLAVMNEGNDLETGSAA